MNHRPLREPPPPGSGDHLSEDVCLDLLHGLVPAQEREAIHAHLARCPACEGLLRDMAAAHECARAHHRVVLSGAGVEVRPAPTRRGARASSVLRLAGAGAAAILAVALLLWPRGGTPGVPELYPLPAGLEGTQLRGAEDAPGAGAILAGLEAYAAGDYRLACRHLARAAGQDPLEDVRKVYLGSALALRGRHREAVAVLESLDLWLLPDPWGAEGLWTLSVELRAMGKIARADAILGELTREPGPVGDRARAARP